LNDPRVSCKEACSLVELIKREKNFEEELEEECDLEKRLKIVNDKCEKLKTILLLWILLIKIIILKVSMFFLK
jgi:hypothetical protein